MVAERTCVSCSGKSTLLEGDVFACTVCDLHMAGDMRTLDYDSSYTEDASLYGEHIKSLNRFQSTPDPLQLVIPFERRIVELLQQAPDIRSLVDLGCGTGRFLRAAESIGLQASGFELASILVEELRRHGRTVAHGGIEAFMQSDLQPDAVTLLEVVEHLSAPGQAITALLEKKRPRALYVVVPDSARRRHFDTRFAEHDVPPNHLTWWNTSSLTKLLEYQGYEVSVEPIAEARRSLLGHIARNRGKPAAASGLEWIQALVSPPTFWLLGTARLR